jgi:hypothetical protein
MCLAERLGCNVSWRLARRVDLDASMFDWFALELNSTVHNSKICLRLRSVDKYLGSSGVCRSDQNNWFSYRTNKSGQRVDIYCTNDPKQRLLPFYTGGIPYPKRRQ